MGLARCCCPPLFGGPSPMALHKHFQGCCRVHTASLLCLLERSRPHCMGLLYLCIPLAPLTPVLVCHRRQLRLLGFSALHAPSLWFLSYPKPSCTAPERHPILQNLSRRERGGSKPAQLHLHRRFPPNNIRTSPFITNTPLLTTIRHCRLSLFGLVPSFLPPLFLLPTPQSPNCGPAGDGTDLTAQTPHVWLAQSPRPPPPPSFMLIRAFPAEVYRPTTTVNPPIDAAGHWAGAAARNAGRK